MTQHYGESYGETYGAGEDETAPTQDPYGGEPYSIPGRIEAEHFDVGGEGVAYHETDPPASWSLDFRTETGVDFKQAPGTDSGISVGRFVAEEWLEYTITVEPGVYELDVRCGTAHPDRALSVRLDGEAIALVPVPETGWGAHEVVRVSPVEIDGEAGERTLRITPTADGVDVDWMQFTATETMAQTATLTLVLQANTLLVTVLDGTQTDDPPVEGATVEVTGAADVTGTTDANGEVAFDGLEVASYHVEAYTAGLHASGDVTASDFS